MSSIQWIGTRWAYSTAISLSLTAYRVCLSVFVCRALFSGPWLSAFSHALFSGLWLSGHTLITLTQIACWRTRRWVTGSLRENLFRTYRLWHTMAWWKEVWVSLLIDFGVSCPTSIQQSAISRGWKTLKTKHSENVTILLERTTTCKIVLPVIWWQIWRQIYNVCYCCLIYCCSAKARDTPFETL